LKKKEPRIKITQPPTIKGHRRQIQQAFQNLISNALKFHNTDVIPFINITSEKISGIDARLPLSEKENQQQF
jgi:signal transduction histidine kinase